MMMKETDVVEKAFFTADMVEKRLHSRTMSVGCLCLLPVSVAGSMTEV